MTMNIKRLLVALIMVWTAQFSYAAETRYISSIKANLLSAPNFKANIVSSLNKGDAVVVKSTKGAWLEITSESNQTGWISKFLTKTTPPSERVTVLPGDTETKLKDVRRRTSAITTAAAARGLAASSEGSKEDLYKSDPKAVEYMESFIIPSNDLETFSKAVKGELK